MLKGAAAALPAAGIFALPSLARGIQENSTPQQRPKVKITDIRTAQVLVHGPQTHVRVYTDSGLYGQGESTDAAVGTASLVHGFRRMLVGQDPLNVDALWEKMRVSGIFAGAQGGQYVTAMTGVEIALWIWREKFWDCRFINCWVENFATKFACTVTPIWTIRLAKSRIASCHGSRSRALQR